MEKVKIYVPLLEEGTPTIRGTHAISLGNSLYKLLEPDDYDSEDEVWEFPPQSIVLGETKKNGDELLLIATKKA